MVRLDKVDHYLGLFGSPVSYAEYERLIAEWRILQIERSAERKQTAHEASSNLTLSEVISRYRDFAAEYYTKNGKTTHEFVQMRYALRHVRQLYGETLARDFGPLKLKAVRQQMIDKHDLSRRVVNSRVKRIKRFFKWAVSEELVSPAVFQGLTTVAGLRRGRTNAREAPPVEPVPDAWVDAVVPLLSPQVAAMVQIQRLTGMRPCEVVLLRPCDIDMSGEVWIYEPAEHKNQWREHVRTVPLGPKAQELLRPFLGLSMGRYLFSPRDAEEGRNEQRALQRNPDRKTKVFPCELRAREKRKASAKQRKRKRPLRDRYDVDSYRRAIKQANKHRQEKEQELIPDWCPLQLRHSRATEIRKHFGIEAAQVSLGHAHANVTEVYAERNLELAIKIAKQTG